MPNIPQISLGTAALVIFTLCAGFVMLRGVGRMLIGTLVLALSAWLAFLVWQTAPTLSVEWTGRSLAAITLGLPSAVFLISFVVLRKALKFISNPFGAPEGAKPSAPLGGGRLVFRLVFSLVPATVLCLIGATVIHHTGAVAEVRAYAEKSLGIAESTPARYFQDLKSAVESALPAPLLGFLDPLANPARVELAKAITEQSNKPPVPAIDPATGRPIPRAIPVDDPELTGLARNGRYGDLLRHPVLSKNTAGAHSQTNNR